MEASVNRPVLNVHTFRERIESQPDTDIATNGPTGRKEIGRFLARALPA
jgi:hypothetical protein